MSVDKFTPEIIEGNYATFLVQLRRCPTCMQPMVKAPKELDTFPTSITLRFSRQAERAGIKLQSSITADNRPICTDCASAGQGGFTCYSCEEFKSSDKEETAIGSPPHYLCTDCYASVPAKEWNEIVEELYGKHQYDYL